MRIWWMKWSKEVRGVGEMKWWIGLFESEDVENSLEKLCIHQIFVRHTLDIRRRIQMKMPGQRECFEWTSQSPMMRLDQMVNTGGQDSEHKSIWWEWLIERMVWVLDNAMVCGRLEHIFLAERLWMRMIEDQERRTCRQQWAWLSAMVTPTSECLEFDTPYINLTLENGFRYIVLPINLISNRVFLPSRFIKRNPWPIRLIARPAISLANCWQSWSATSDLMAGNTRRTSKSARYARLALGTLYLSA